MRWEFWSDYMGLTSGISYLTGSNNQYEGMGEGGLTLMLNGSNLSAFCGFPVDICQNSNSSGRYIIFTSSGIFEKLIHSYESFDVKPLY